MKFLLHNLGILTKVLFHAKDVIPVGEVIALMEISEMGNLKTKKLIGSSTEVRSSKGD